MFTIKQRIGIKIIINIQDLMYFDKNNTELRKVVNSILKNSNKVNL